MMRVVPCADGLLYSHSDSTHQLQDALPVPLLRRLELLRTHANNLQDTVMNVSSVRFRGGGDLLWSRRVERKVGAHLKKGHSAKRRLNGLHLRVLGEQHVLDARLAVVERTVPRHVVAAAKRVF